MFEILKVPNENPFFPFADTDKELIKVVPRSKDIEELRLNV